MHRLIILLIVFSVVHSITLQGQDPLRFDNEIKIISKTPSLGSPIVFTGSSSIRMWDSLGTDCAGHKIVNTGFGGSHMSDLLFFIDQTVLNFDPSKVFIYEGDNDIADRENPTEILEEAKQIVKRIQFHNSQIDIYFIAAKPSPARWAYKEAYNILNTLLEEYASQEECVEFIDVWNIMLSTTGRPDASIFISDSLHMNRKGYLLWKDTICPYVD